MLVILDVRDFVEKLSKVIGPVICCNLHLFVMKTNKFHKIYGTAFLTNFPHVVQVPHWCDADLLLE